MTTIIDIDHETGDLSQYTSTVTDSGDLSVAAGAALGGTSYGLSVLIDDTTAIYGTKTVTTNTSGVVRARFYIDPNTLTMTNGDLFTVFWVANSSGIPFGWVELYKGGTNYQVRAVMVNDASGASYIGAITITDAPHYLEYKAVRATNSTSSDGSMEFWIDGVRQGTATRR